MTTESGRVTIRIPAEKLEVLQNLVSAGAYDTLSDVVRAAIDNFVEEKLTPGHIERMTVEFPKGNIVELEELVHSGDSVSIEDAVRNAVREYLRARLTKEVRKRYAQP
ncbi:MAG: CopG family transcriptional regulator [Candidatus Thermoplasmatota archaeon]